MAYYGKKRYPSAASQEGTKRKWNPSWAKKEPEVERGSLYRPILNPSSEQIAIFNHVVSNSNNLCVQALAGTGKTASAIGSMYRLPRDSKILYVIFANRNAAEARGKAPPWVDVFTVHAFCLRALKARFGKNIEVDDRGTKDNNIAASLFGYEDEKAEVRYNFIQAMGLAKGSLCETVQDIIDVCASHEVDMCGYEEQDFCSKVLKGMEISEQQYMTVSFDDMIWLCVRKNVTLPQYQFTFADEAQDLSPARIEIVLRSVAPTGKLVAIGDRNQAIFGFTSADPKAFDTLIERSAADQLPLYTTFRCGKKIAELAKTIVPEYQAYEGNPDGEVVEKTALEMVRDAAPGDFIISRTNAPLVGLALNFLKEGRRASVLGKELGKSLTYTIKRSGATDVDGFVDWLENWKNTECARLMKKNRPCDAIMDRYECLMAFAEGTNNLSEMRENIERMFVNEKDMASRIVLQTSHKSKGLDASRVWLLRKTFKPEKGGEEARIWYVAITRAINSLFIVNGETSRADILPPQEQVAAG